jgi:hypothetical protein
VTIWCVLIACWIPKATNEHSDYFSTAAMVARALFSVTLYVHCLPALSPLVDKLTLARLVIR